MQIEQKTLPLQSSSKATQSAKRAGIIIDIPTPHLPVIEQEETDTM